MKDQSRALLAGVQLKAHLIAQAAQKRGQQRSAPRATKPNGAGHLHRSPYVLSREPEPEVRMPLTRLAAILISVLAVLTIRQGLCSQFQTDSERNIVSLAGLEYKGAGIVIR